MGEVLHLVAGQRFVALIAQGSARDRDGWKINGEKIWDTGLHVATHDLVFARPREAG